MNLNFNKICRLCLRFCDRFVDLNERNGTKTLSSDLAEKINFCYVLQIDLSEGFPTKVCYECVQVVSCFYTAKKNILISEKLLRDVLYARKKLKKSVERHMEKNVSTADIIEITQEREKSDAIQVVNRSVLKTPEPISLTVKESKFNYSKKNVCTSGSGATPVVDTEKEIIICEPDKIVTQNSECDEDSRVRKKKKDDNEHNKSNGEKLSNVGNKNIDIFLQLRNLKKFKHQHKQSSKTFKDKLNKTVPGTDSFSKENVFKEIGTVIDANNILSPNIKRTRKSAG